MNYKKRCLRGAALVITLGFGTMIMAADARAQCIEVLGEGTCCCPAGYYYGDTDCVPASCTEEQNWACPTIPWTCTPNGGGGGGPPGGQGGGPPGGQGGEGNGGGSCKIPKQQGGCPPAG
jgi:hypothetical protein